MSDTPTFKDVDRELLKFESDGQVETFYIESRRMVPGKYGETLAVDILHFEKGDLSKSPSELRVFPPTVLARKLGLVDDGHIAKVTRLGKPKGEDYYDFSVLDGGLFKIKDEPF